MLKEKGEPECGAAPEGSQTSDPEGRERPGPAPRHLHTKTGVVVYFLGLANTMVADVEVACGFLEGTRFSCLVGELETI